MLAPSDIYLEYWFSFLTGNRLQDCVLVSTWPPWTATCFVLLPTISQNCFCKRIFKMNSILHARQNYLENFILVLNIEKLTNQG